MTQHDFNIANQGAANFRTDISNALVAIQSNNSGAAASTSTIAFMQWADSSTNLMLKFRNSADSAWLAKLNLDSDMVTSWSTAYTTVASDHQKLINCNASGGAFSITVLGSTTAGEGYEFIVKKTDSSVNAVTIDGNASETIDGATTLVLSNQYEAAWLRVDGSNLHVISRTPGIATQAQQETGTNITALVTPGRQHYHPSAPKAWCRLSGTGAISITSSYNVASLIDNGTGDYDVNFTNAMSGGSYTAVGAAGTAAGSILSLNSINSTYININTVTHAGAAADLGVVCVAVLGDM